MNRWFYIMAVVVVSIVMLPSMAWAQLDAAAISRAQRQGQNVNLGGDFGGMEDQQGEENEDSTKINRIRKPLESYYFDDSIRALPNFQWTVDRNMNDVKIAPLDTLITNWRIDYPYYTDGVGDMTLGGLGQSTLPFNYFERSNSPDFEFAQSYDAYTYKMENVPFYNSKTPYLNFMYLESGQKLWLIMYRLRPALMSIIRRAVQRACMIGNVREIIISQQPLLIRGNAIRFMLHI